MGKFHVPKIYVVNQVSTPFLQWLCDLQVTCLGKVLNSKLYSPCNIQVFGHHIEFDILNLKCDKTYFTPHNPPKKVKKKNWTGLLSTSKNSVGVITNIQEVPSTILVLYIQEIVCLPYPFP